MLLGRPASGSKRAIAGAPCCSSGSTTKPMIRPPATATVWLRTSAPRQTLSAPRSAATSALRQTTSAIVARLSSSSPREDRRILPTMRTVVVVTSDTTIPATAYASTFAASMRTRAGEAKDGDRDRLVAPLAGHADHAEQHDQHAAGIGRRQVVVQGLWAWAAVRDRPVGDQHRKRHRHAEQRDEGPG